MSLLLLDNCLGELPPFWIYKFPSTIYAMRRLSNGNFSDEATIGNGVGVGVAVFVRSNSAVGKATGVKVGKGVGVLVMTGTVTDGVVPQAVKIAAKIIQKYRWAENFVVITISYLPDLKLYDGLMVTQRIFSHFTGTWLGLYWYLTGTLLVLDWDLTHALYRSTIHE